MRNVTENFKIDIRTYGRQLGFKIKVNDADFNVDNLNYIKPAFNTPLFKTVMHQVEIDSKLYMPKDTKVYIKVGVKVNEKNYKYVELGTYYVKSCERQEDTNSYRILAYTKMKNAMIDYDLTISEKITVRNYLIAICERLDWNTENIPATFINSTKLVAPSLHTGINYTFRDALDEIATITCSFLLFKNDDFYLSYLTNTNETIDESYLDEDNITIGEKYLINSLVFSRAEESDNIYRKDDDSIETNGLHEYRISDCQLLSTNDRDDYIDEMFNYLKTLEFYIFDIQSKGILFLEACDMFNLVLNGVTYPVALLNNEINIEDGLTENLYMDEPEETETEYKYADDTDKKINQAYILVDKQNKKITQLTQEQSATSEKLTKVEQNVNGFTTTVSSLEKTTIKTVQVQYALSDSTTEAPTSGWSTTAPTWESGKYMWQRTVTTYSDDTTKTSEPTCIQGANGKDGTNGKDGDTGIGVNSLETEYYLSTSDEEQAGGEWLTTEPKYEAGKHYWTRTKITWTDNSVTYTDPILAEGINNANQGLDNITNTEGTASGKNIHIEDSSEEPLVDIVVKGETKQEGEPSPDYPSEIENVEGKNLFNKDTASLNFQLNTNGSITGGSGKFVSDYIKINENKSYTSAQAYTLKCWYDKDKNFISSQSVKTAQAPSGAKYVRINGSSDSIDMVQLEEGTVATEYAPHNSLEFEVIGKNWFDNNQSAVYSTGNILTTLETGKRATNSIAGNYRYSSVLIPNSDNLLGKQITISADITPSASNSGRMVLYGLNSSNNVVYNFGEIISSGSKTITLPSVYPANVERLALLFYSNSTGTVAEGDYVDYTNVQVEIGNTKTDYEPYKSQTETFPLAEGQKLYEGSYLADDGIHQKFGELSLAIADMNNNEKCPGWTNLTQLKEDYPSQNIRLDQLCNNAYCNITKNKGSIGVNTTGSGILYLDTGTFGLTQTEWKEQYPDLVFNLQYELPEEEIIPYTQEQQEAWNKIKELYTYKNITNITSTADLDIVYVRDNGLSDMYETKQNAKKKYAQIQITVDGIKETVKSNETVASNKYTELTEKFNGYVPTSKALEIEKSVETLKTDSYTRTEINTKLTDGSVTKVFTTAGTFDDNGLTIEKTDAKTKGNFNEKGITVMDATSSSAEELLFAGYDEELSETIVRTKNINVEKYLTKCNIAREEAYTNLTLGGKGIGVFIL